MVQVGEDSKKDAYKEAVDMIIEYEEGLSTRTGDSEECSGEH
jgi:hypothetical protein